MKHHESRILFLKQFTRELILQSKTKEEITLSQPQPIQITQIQIPERKVFIPKIQRTQFLLKPIVPRKPIQLMQKREIQPTQPQKQEYSPEYEQNPEAMNLEKLNFLLKDPKVISIECPGQDKFLIVKTILSNQLTKIRLSKGEIDKILEQFSQKSKIPLIGGLFKAAIGNLIITAVTSDLVGSRFIISKITPSTIISTQNLE